MKEKNQLLRWPYHKTLFTRGGAEPLLGLCPPDLLSQPATTICASPDDGKLLLEARAFICWPWINKHNARRKKKNSIFLLFPSAAGALHEEIKHLRDTASATTMLTPCPRIALETGKHQSRPAEAPGICKPPKPRASAQRSSANPTPHSSSKAPAEPPASGVNEGEEG